MNNFKKVVFIALVVLFLCFLGTKYLLKIIKNDNPTFLNAAEEVTLTKGDYLIGKQVKAGFYDVISLSDDVSLMPVKLSKGDMIVGQRLENNAHAIVVGNGSVKLLPAEYVPLKMDAQNKYRIVHSGNYMVGKQILEGKYKISYKVRGKGKVKEKPFVQILPGYGKDQLDSFAFEKASTYKINLETGNILDVRKSLEEEYDSVVIELTLIK
ncbi:hypothetical protein [Fictibacillus sp. 26RED30]|uniref:hypothetical protein n=1 Tax=Fictibacillus sp. 26RED30 TaxID=2745877 RepID=UPI0018CF6B9E|nr:hypothetical protein [Fictibacillus sp. 26RED30]MBH0161830.1 hypothetical protein [Fictibacillus sp. 26RED30]